MGRRHLLVIAAIAVFSVAVACSPAARIDEPGRAAATTDTGSVVATARPSPSPAATLERTPVLDAPGVPDLGMATTGRTFHTGFEDANDLSSFYVTPQSGLTHHEVGTDVVHSGTKAHKAWVTGVGAPGIEKDGPNHRGYPTIQLRKLTGSDGAGGFASPTLTELWVWLDVSLTRGQWFSFATFSNDRTDRWDRVVTVNLDPAGFVNVFHVPRYNEHDVAMQRTDVAFPMRTWVRLTTYLDWRADGGVIAVWQDGVLVTAARVDPGVDPPVQATRTALGIAPDELSDGLEQAHFGLYAPPEVGAALVYNDDLTIAEVRPASP